MLNPTEIERTNLDAHVSLCALRYSQLESRLQSVEQSITDVYTLLSDIRDRLGLLQTDSVSKWSQFQWVLIGILLSVSGWALANVFA